MCGIGGTGLSWQIHNYGKSDIGMEGAGAYPTGEPGIDVAGKLRRIAEVEDRA